MRIGGKLSVIAAIAVSAAGCNQAANGRSKQSVTVKLQPPRPYKPEPGFSLATDLPVDGPTPAKSGDSPQS